MLVAKGWGLDELPEGRKILRMLVVPQERNLGSVVA